MCGADGRTYTNECRAACKGVEVASQGGCRSRNSNGILTGRKPGERLLLWVCGQWQGACVADI